jgi:hypothetical protein
MVGGSIGVILVGWYPSCFVAMDIIHPCMTVGSHWIISCDWTADCASAFAFARVLGSRSCCYYVLDNVNSL